MVWYYNLIQVVCQLFGLDALLCFMDALSAQVCHKADILVNVISINVISLNLCALVDDICHYHEEQKASEEAY